MLAAFTPVYVHFRPLRYLPDRLVGGESRQRRCNRRVDRRLYGHGIRRHRHRRRVLAATGDTAHGAEAWMRSIKARRTRRLSRFASLTGSRCSRGYKARCSQSEQQHYLIGATDLTPPFSLAGGCGRPVSDIGPTGQVHPLAAPAPQPPAHRVRLSGWAFVWLPALISLGSTPDQRLNARRKLLTSSKPVARPISRTVMRPRFSRSCARS